MLAQRVRVLEEPLRDIGSVQEDYAGRLKALVNQVADEGGADGIVIAGAPLAVLAGEIRNELAVPVIDGGSSAITRVEPKKATKGSFTHGPVKPSRGLPDAARTLASSGTTGLIHARHSRRPMFEAPMYPIILFRMFQDLRL
jgi:hypothetical protein